MDELKIEANGESFVIVLQHGGNDVTCKRSLKKKDRHKTQTHIECPHTCCTYVSVEFFHLLFQILGNFFYMNTGLGVQL